MSERPIEGPGAYYARRFGLAPCGVVGPSRRIYELPAPDPEQQQEPVSRCSPLAMLEDAIVDRGICRHVPRRRRAE